MIWPLVWSVAAGLLVLGVLMTLGSRRGRERCPRCGERVSAHDAHQWCIHSRCPHQRKPDLGSLS